MPKWKKPKKAHLHRRNPEKENFWRKQIADQSVSGLSKPAFCKDRGLNEHNFRYWMEEIKRRDAESGANAKRQAARVSVTSAARKANPFVPVRLSVSGKPTEDHCVEILLAGGKSIRVTERTPMDLLSQVIRVLEGKC